MVLKHFDVLTSKKSRKKVLLAYTKLLTVILKPLNYNCHVFRSSKATISPLRKDPHPPQILAGIRFLKKMTFRNCFLIRVLFGWKERVPSRIAFKSSSSPPPHATAAEIFFFSSNSEQNCQRGSGTRFFVSRFFSWISFSGAVHRYQWHRR